MNKVLVILPNNLGDVILALPVLDGIKALSPETEISFFVEQGYEGGLEHFPCCDRIVAFPRKELHDRCASVDWRNGIDGIAKAAAELKSLGFSRVINLSQHAYIPYIVSLIGCPDTLGAAFLREGNLALRDVWSRHLYAIPFARRYNALHATDIYRRIAGVGSAARKEGITVTDQELRASAHLLESNGWNPHDHPIIVLQPGAAFAAKRWPIDHFIALGKMLVNDGFRILVTGAPAERELADALKAALGGQCISVAGTLTFRETIALLPLVTGCVTGDTAIMHAAASLNVRVVALFGPTNPVETGPYGPGHYVVSGRCARRPCFCFDCKTRLCMKSIAPGPVYACVKDAPPAAAGCDIFKTASRHDGTTSLTAVYNGGAPYVDPAGAEMTRLFADPEYVPEEKPSPEAITESVRFCETLDQMAADLERCLKTRDAGAVPAFEQRRATLATYTEIGAFWTALLNLGLNSVPLLDPGAGIRQSIDVCVDTAGRVRRSVAAFR